MQTTWILLLFTFSLFLGTTLAIAAQDKPVVSALELTRTPHLLDCSEETQQQRSTCTSTTLSTFITENIQYPAVALQEEAQGLAYARLVIAPDGTLESFKLIRPTNHEALNQEALRVLQLFQEQGVVWRAGEKNEVAVRSSLVLPIRFTLP